MVKLSHNKIIKFFDLFAGIGGFRLGAENSLINDIKFKPIGSCEIDKDCIRMYQKVFKTDGDYFIDDAKRIKTGVRSDESSTLPDFNLLFAGFPCQPFSNVGLRNGFQDPRGKLFFYIRDILKYYKPRYFILENVQKLSTINTGAVLISMVKSLEKAGYHVYVWDLLASDYGLPQKRRRYFFCGVKKTYRKKKLLLKVPPTIPKKNWKYLSTWHLLEGNVDEKHYIPDKTRQTVLYKNHKWMGGVEIDNPIARPITATMGKWHRANQDNYFSDKYTRKDNPDPFIRPQVNLESEPIRRITPLEGFRLQGFPVHYEKARKELGLSFTSVYRLIGNAVPVDLARSVITHFIGAYD
jgi:DNA (cytosine-5)-methyltransferase 1